MIRIVLLTGFIAGQAFAQDITGNIFGTVSDPSGGVVPNAKVTVEATALGRTVRALSTNSSGGYSATLLPVGTYSVTVEAPGFRRARQTDIELNVSERLTANFTLEVGDVTQEITVTAAANTVELQNAQQSGLITGQQVRELSLNNRHFAQLLALQPGVSSNISDSIFVGTTNPTGGNNLVAFSVNGTRQSQNNWLVDGADNVDRGTNITIQQYPSIDAIEEMKIVRTPYSAEFGRAGGGQISVVTKSGSNAFHGTAYEFFRNDKLNANNFFNNVNRVDRPPLRYNDFGFTVGGPVIKNRTFFFYSQEWRRVINYNASNVQIPTLEERQGRFVNPVCTQLSADFASCLQTGTTITNINPVARQYIQDVFSKLPAPTNGNNLQVPLRGVFNSRQEIVRGDHTFNDKLTLSARFLHDAIPTIEPGGLFTNVFTPGVATTSTNSPGRSLVIRGTSILSPTWTNEASWAWSRGGIFSSPIGLAAKVNSPNINPKLPFAGNPDRIPTVSFVGGFSTIASYGPYDNFSYNHAFSDNMTKVIGKHTLKFGGQFNLYRKNENQLADNAGGFAITNTPRPTGSTNVVAQQSWANFLLGAVSTYTQNSIDLTADLRTKGIEFYLQDDYRIRKNLSINLGLRYSNFRQPHDQNNLLTNFDIGAFDPTKAPRIDSVTGNRIAGTGDPLNGIIQSGRNSRFGNKVGRENNMDFAPRIGLAWDPFGTGKTSFRAGYGMFYDTVLLGTLEQNMGANPTPSYSTVSIPNTRLDDPGAGTAAVSLAPVSPRGVATDFQTPYVQQWSAEIQRQLAGDMLFSVAYVGTKGTNLVGIVDINQLRPGQAAAAGLVPAGGYLVAGNSPRLNFLRPYLGYRSINVIESWFNSNYHGLQTSLSKRFGKLGSVNVNYTWSRAMTDNGSDRSNAPQNTSAWKEDYGRSVLDRKHVFTANYVYPLPFFQGSNALVKNTLGGWELSGIVTYNSGLPLTVTSALGNDPGGLGIIGPSVAGPRPDVVGNGVLDSSERTVNRWFNTAAFAEVPVGVARPGNSGRGTITAPGIVKWDFSVFKQFAVSEKVKFQLRGEAFNVLNHTNFNSPTVALGNANFGRITGARDPRNIQIGAKVVF